MGARGRSSRYARHVGRTRPSSRGTTRSTSRTTERTGGRPIATGTGTTAVLTIAFAPQSARYVRVTQTSTATVWWSIYDFNVYGTALSRTAGRRPPRRRTGATSRQRAGRQHDHALEQRGCADRPVVQGRHDVAARRSTRSSLDAGATTRTTTRVATRCSCRTTTTNWGTPVATGTGTTAVHRGQFRHAARPLHPDRPDRHQFSTTWSIEELNVEGQPTTQIAWPRGGWVATGSSTTGPTCPPTHWTAAPRRGGARRARRRASRSRSIC